ncbi:MAG: leucine-rich repeat domain-containing protein [Lachnospiraceae bacterium]
MQKQKTHKGIQRFVCICSMFIMAFLFVLTDVQEAKAKSKSSGYCTLQSVTIEVNGKKYVCDGSLNYIPVEYNADWKEFVKTIKITDYQVLVNDCCSHVKGHDSVEAGLYEEMGEDEFNYWKFLTYEDGKNSYTDMEDSLDKSYYEVMFCLDGDTETSIVTAFRKECPITYDLDGGTFLEGVDVPTVCGAGEVVNLPIPMKSDGQFLRWTTEEGNNGGYLNVDENWYCWYGNGESLTFVAVWDDDCEPVNIGTATINLDAEVGFYEGGVRPKPTVTMGNSELSEGKDYYLSYENNDKVAAANSDNPPTVTITGIGMYTGTVDKTFSIVKGSLSSNADLSIDIINGQQLSVVNNFDFVGIHDRSGHAVTGSYAWEQGNNYVPTSSVGGGESCYVIFTPEKDGLYEQKRVRVWVVVKQGTIEDCSVSLASEQQSYSYTGEEIKPEVIVKDGDTVLEEGSDYEVSYSGYINPARSTDKYAPTVTVKGKGVYTGSQKLTYTIEKGTPYIATAPTASAITYGEALGASKLSGGVVQNSESDTTSVNGTFTWKEAATKPTVADSSMTEYVVVFKPKDKDNYNDVETTLTLTVKKAEAAPNKPESTMNTAYTNDTVGKITLPKDWVWKEADKTRTLTVGEAVTATAVYTGEDAGNYETESVDISITRQACIHQTYVNGVCSVCDDIFETTVNGITYKVVTETGTDGKPVGMVVTVSGEEKVAVAVTGTSDDFTVSDGKVIIPGEIMVSGSEGTEQTLVVIEISENAFKNVDEEVTEIEVPDTVTTVGNGAFGDAITITFNGNTVPDGIANAISGNGVTVNVPEGAGDSYKEALGESVTIVEIHTHIFDTAWTNDETYHWHAATCGHEEAVADKTKHTFGSWVTVTEATEDAKGLKERSCVCGYKETEEIDKLAHTTHVKDEGIRVEPTCEEKGSITYKCTKCGKVMEVVELAALGHKWDGGKVTKEATATEKGVKTYTCTVCKETKAEEIPALGVPEAGTTATSDDGTATYKVTASDLTKGTVDYVAPTNKDITTVSIPDMVTIDGITYMVTSIADNAFADNKKLTKVTIDGNVKTIGKKAFYKCTKLKTVKIGKNVTSIGSNAFYGCKKLKTITIKTTKLTRKNVGSKAFNGIYSKATIKVPKSKLTSYKRILKAKGVSSKAKIKK